MGSAISGCCSAGGDGKEFDKPDGKGRYSERELVEQDRDRLDLRESSDPACGIVAEINTRRKRGGKPRYSSMICCDERRVLLL